MDISYSVRSQFLESCESAIREHRLELIAGGIVRLGLGDGGYDGQVVVIIRSNDRAFFGTDWNGSDATRFPARIRAAATALWNCNCDGAFEISHTDGSLAIRAA